MTRHPYRDPTAPKRAPRTRPCACDVCERTVTAPDAYCDACLAACVVVLGDGRYPLKRWARIIAHMTPEQKQAALEATGKLLEAGGRLLRRVARAANTPAAQTVARVLKGPSK